MWFQSVLLFFCFFLKSWSHLEKIGIYVYAVTKRKSCIWQQRKDGRWEKETGPGPLCDFLLLSLFLLVLATSCARLLWFE